jgi:hypothetical protein
VESLLQLRKLVEQEAVAEQESKHVATVLPHFPGKKIVVGWDKMLASADYLLVRDYVAYIRYVGAFVPSLLLGYGEQPEGLSWMLAVNAQSEEFFGPIKAIEVEIDGDCKTQPAQERFVHGRMSCVKKAPATLVLTVRRDWMETNADLNGLSLFLLNMLFVLFIVFSFFFSGEKVGRLRIAISATTAAALWLPGCLLVRQWRLKKRIIWKSIGLGLLPTKRTDARTSCRIGRKCARATSATTTTTCRSTHGQARKTVPRVPEKDIGEVVTLAPHARAPA